MSARYLIRFCVSEMPALLPLRTVMILLLSGSSSCFPILLKSEGCGASNEREGRASLSDFLLGMTGLTEGSDKCQRTALRLLGVLDESW